MNVKLLTFVCIFFSTAISAEINKNQVKEFIDTYFDALRKNNEGLLKKLSVSNGMCQHISAKRVLDDVEIQKYTFEITPFSKDSDDIKFAMALNKGSPVVMGDPTHFIKIKWIYTQEAYKPGHTCHHLVGKSAEMLLAISDQNGIIEHSYCQKTNTSQKKNNIKLTKPQFDEIKKNILEQKMYSRLSTRIFIMKNYGLESQEAKEIVKQVCDQL